MGTTAVDNVILLADSYKSGHYKQYPPGTTSVYSYFESRGGKFPYTVFFGLQYILKKWFVGKVVTKEKILEAKEILDINEDGWNYILENHDGHLPIRIKAVAEGSIIPSHNVLFTVENTDPKLPWLTNYLETILVQTWYPSTVSTLSRIQKQIIYKHLCDTHDNADSIEFKLHECGYRGVSSVESGAIGGAAHLVNFQATDTVAAVCLLKKYYHHSMRSSDMIASEHSTVTSWGPDGELDSMEHLFKISGNTKRICILVDSYNAYHAISDLVANKLKEKISEFGQQGGIITVRPDSGDPATICLQTLEILEEAFGRTINSKGYKALPSFLDVIQTDSIDYIRINEVLEHLKKNGWSAENVGFSCGGALLQRVDRDTQKFAYKCSHVIIDGEGRDVFKDPITDPGKKSKKGRLILNKQEGKYVTFENGTGDASQDLLQPVFENGVLLKDFTLEEIRKRAALTADDEDIFQLLFKK